MGLIAVALGRAIPWYATQANETPPSGYVYAQGQVLHAGEHDFPASQCIGGAGTDYQVADLRNKFVLGADITKAAGLAAALGDTNASAPGPMGAGGLNGFTIATANLPVHSHTGSLSSGLGADSGDHAHGWSISGHGAHSHSDDSGFAFATAASNWGQNTTSGTYATPVTVGDRAGTTASDPGHSHSLAPGADDSHAHTMSISSSGGVGDVLGGNPYDQRPRFCAVVWIVKVKW